MKKVLINGDIGYDWFSEDGGVTAKTITRQLEGLDAGEDIQITINSAGGSVYEGIVIFNMIRDYAKAHSISVVIDCMAMSIASYIALAARTVDAKAKITALENSIFAIHNPYMYMRGDYRDMKKMSDYLEKITVVYASAHIAVSGKTEKEIRSAMDDETFYVGQEIQSAGFANDFEAAANTETGPAESPAARHDNAVITAKIALNKTIERAQEAEAKNAAAFYDDLKKAAALFAYNNAPKPAAASGGKPGEKINANPGGSMTLEELKAQNKELYEKIFALGETAGLEKERARVNAHLLLGEKSASLALAAKHIKAGVSTSDEAVQAEYFAAKMDAAHINARSADDPGDIHTGGEGGGAPDDAKLEAAFRNGAMGKDTRGRSWLE
jgi:ATP-dependent protease ClpP protease subunit